MTYTNFVYLHYLKILNRFEEYRGRTDIANEFNKYQYALILHDRV